MTAYFQVTLSEYCKKKFPKLLADMADVLVWLLAAFDSSTVQHFIPEFQYPFLACPDQ